MDTIGRQSWTLTVVRDFKSSLDEEIEWEKFYYGRTSEELEDKEKDAYESGLRRGVRSHMLKEISDNTRTFITQNERTSADLDRNGQKLARVISKLEKMTGLLEVNLKEDSALEDFFLSSLRIWSAK